AHNAASDPGERRPCACRPRPTSPPPHPRAPGHARYWGWAGSCCWPAWAAALRSPVADPRSVGRFAVSLQADHHRPPAAAGDPKAVVGRLIDEVINAGRLDIIDEIYTPQMAPAARRWITPFRES